MARPHRCMTVRPGLLAMALAVAGPAAAQSPAQPEPSAEKGLVLAQRLCSNCHLVEGSDGALPAGIPSLRGIANRPDQSARRIENALIQPHAPMPDMRLTKDEIQHLLAYLDTLRTEPGAAPLLPPATPAKPKYPKPS